MVSSVLMLSKESVPNESKKEMVSRGTSREKATDASTLDNGRLSEMEVFFLSLEHFERREVYMSCDGNGDFSSPDSCP